MGETAALTGVEAAKDLLEQVTSSVSIDNVVAILGVGLAAAAGFFLMYWGGRKLIRMVTSAFKKGRIGM